MTSTGFLLTRAIVSVIAFFSVCFLYVNCVLSASVIDSGRFSRLLKLIFSLKKGITTASVLVNFLLSSIFIECFCFFENI